MPGNIKKQKKKKKKKKKRKKKRSCQQICKLNASRPPCPPFASVTGCRGAGGKHVNVVLPEGGLVDLEFGDNKTLIWRDCRQYLPGQSVSGVTLNDQI